ncbi:MAG TPA: HEPN domain-containing protein [Ktedonobacteraceae bacterium]|nr:HEPN domain-containing protein [Ktedonobacteraceae bacterium]
MSQMHAVPDDSNQEELEQLLLQEVHLDDGEGQAQTPPIPRKRLLDIDDDADEENSDVLPDSDVQGAFGLFAEATQDMATASLELNLGRHFACVDYCNQVAEKAAQAVSLLRFGRRMPYNHDLRELGMLVDAPEKILEDMAALTPFHPEAFYADTPPEEADEVISAEQARGYVQQARQVLQWAKSIVLNP